MSRHPAPVVAPADLFRTLVCRPLRWMVPTVLITLAAVTFAILRPRTWEAAQTLVVRAEVSIDSTRQPNSTRADDVKTAQETILELAHSHDVLERSLREVGPAAESNAETFPSAKEIEELGDAIKLGPPKGSEFGKTDIFYLKAEAKSRERAIALAGAVSRQVQTSYEDLRQTKAKSLIQELENTAALARKALETSTHEVTELERSIGGGDVGELRILNELPSGNSDLRLEATAIEAELRKERTTQQSNEQLLTVLKAAQVNPGELIASTGNLLTNQPGLKRLKDGLVDAQLKSALLMSSMSPDHPLVKAARIAEQEIGTQLHGELAIAIKGVEADLKLSADHIATLDAQKTAIRARLDKLVEVRARYSNLVATSKHRADILKSAEMELSEARAQLAAAHNGSLLQLIGEPVTGTRPMGPGRTAIVAAGFLGGLLVGLGIVVLTAQPQIIELPQSPIVQPVADAVVQSVVQRPAVVREQAPNPQPFVSTTTPVYAEPFPAYQPTSYSTGTAVVSKSTNPLTLKQALERISGSGNRN